MDDATIIPFRPGDHKVGDGYVFEPDKIVEAAMGDFQNVIVFGINKEGQFDMRCSHGSREVMWLLNRGIHFLLMETE